MFISYLENEKRHIISINKDFDLYAVDDCLIIQSLDHKEDYLSIQYSCDRYATLAAQNVLRQINMAEDNTDIIFVPIDDEESVIGYRYYKPISITQWVKIKRAFWLMKWRIKNKLVHFRKPKKGREEK